MTEPTLGSIMEEVVAEAKRLALEAVLAEREACAKIAEATPPWDRWSDDPVSDLRFAIAAAIRRGKDGPRHDRRNLPV